MSLKILKGEATPSSVTLFFSDALDATTAVNITNYSVKSPAGPTAGTELRSGTPTYHDLFRAVVITLSAAQKRGDWVFVTTADTLKIASGAAQPALSIAIQVNGDSEVKETTKAVEEAVAYPVLTEQVSFSPSGGLPSSGGGGGYGSSQMSDSLGVVAANAVSDVLGWKVNSNDSRGFVGALTQSFSLTDVEGHVEATYTPRSYTVQTDLSQGITGAQASLYTRAKDALDKCLPLLDGLYSLDPETESEDADALRALARSQMTEIVKEFGNVGGPSITRVDTYFHILLGVPRPALLADVPTDADALISGTLAELRDVLGISFNGNPFSNNVADEEDITNFRIIVDYMTSLLQTWINNRKFFDLGSTSDAFFGTQLVLISRQLSVVLETVNEVRFAMNSVFIGPSERQTLLIQFNDPNRFKPMFVEDILGEVDRFAGEEGPRLVQDGGKLGVRNNVVPVVDYLQDLVKQARHPANLKDLPDGFRTARVKNALGDLHDQLKELHRLAKPVGRSLPAPEGAVIAMPGVLEFDAVVTGTTGFSSASGSSRILTLANLGGTPKSVSFAIKTTPGLFKLPASFELAPGQMSVTITSTATPTDPPSDVLIINVVGAKPITVPINIA
jgi:hypothetical protein